MKKVITTTMLLALLLYSCDKKISKEQLYTETTEQEKINTNSKKIADLPIQIDSITTQILIHPIILVDKEPKKYLDRSSYTANNNTIDYVNHYNDIITGNIVNLNFEVLDSNKLVPLSTQDIKINSITFLRDVYNSTTKELLLYSVLDTDTNNDKLIDAKDNSTLYISHINGSNFKRLSLAKNDILYRHKFTLDNQRLYFSTLQDINKDNTLDTKDKLHYGYIDLTSVSLVIHAYTPL